MNSVLCQRDPTQYRFPVPNDIWKYELKPQGFAILIYLWYRYLRFKNSPAPDVDSIAAQLHMSVDMAAEQIATLNRRGLLRADMTPVLRYTDKYFFSLPDELFFLNIGHGAITVYAYLLYCEDRCTHQCHPSYRTMADAVHLTVSTVMKHIAKLVDKQFIAVENTTYLDRYGRRRNGNNLYTILPIHVAMDHYYQQQMLRLEEQQRWLQVQQTFLIETDESTPPEPL